MHVSLFRLLSITFLCLVSYTISAQTKRALFVGIDKYVPTGGWTDIHGTNDYKLVKPMLEKAGYADGNIHALLNKQAVKTNIVAELKTLTQQSGAGDYVYIHFSCHGQQMIDDNGDEPDGLDEALIPYDAKRRFTQNEYEGENHLRDDELEILLDNIRAKLGAAGNITVVLDACHSGTATRDADDGEYYRGTTYIFGPDGSIPAEPQPDKVNWHFKKDKKLSNLTVFSACLPNERNSECKIEGEYFGSLTYVFCKSANDSEVLSNIGFAKKLQSEMDSLFAKRRRKQTLYFESTNENSKFNIGE